MLNRFWSDEAGFIVSTELILIATILVIGMLVGLVSVRDQVVQELADVAEAIKAGQSEGSIRAGDAHQMAAMCLLITQSTIQSAQMVADLLDAESLDVELAHSLNGYLKP